MIYHPLTAMSTLASIYHLLLFDVPVLSSKSPGQPLTVFYHRFAIDLSIAGTHFQLTFNMPPL